MLEIIIFVIGCISLVFIGTVLLNLRLKIISIKRKKQGYNEEIFLDLLKQEGVSSQVATIILNAFRECSTSDFLVKPEDTLTNIFGIEGYADKVDFLQETARKCNRNFPFNKIISAQIVTVRDAAVFIENLDVGA
jgi:hypothetical protein